MDNIWVMAGLNWKYSWSWEVCSLYSSWPLYTPSLPSFPPVLSASFPRKKTSCLHHQVSLMFDVFRVKITSIQVAKQKPNSKKNAPTLLSLTPWYIIVVGKRQRSHRNLQFSSTTITDSLYGNDVANFLVLAIRSNLILTRYVTIHAN